MSFRKGILKYRNQTFLQLFLEGEKSEKSNFSFFFAVGKKSQLC